MRYAVIDVETTGFSPINDRIVEAACVIVEDGRIRRTWSSLVNPGRPIPAYATRVHGITDDAVADAPRIRSVQSRLRLMCGGATVAAHNAAFDLGFLPGLSHLPSICTVQLARRCFPEAPNHKNQTLREYLRIDADPLFAGLPSHRALSDALVTAAILLQCIAVQRPTSRRMRRSRFPSRLSCRWF
ncbi:MAG: 3'-5' exonuclease [Candidatus Eremiobacteraeota bacterium]|nr:3'-5' exonuclease [Candidatus Eremiobacteraeota bacterium]